MLLRATARRRPSLSPSAGDQQGLGARVGDEHAPFGVGEQDGVGHRVEERALAPACRRSRLRERAAAPAGADQRRGQHAADPADERRGSVCGGLTDEQPGGDVLAPMRAYMGRATMGTRPRGGRAALAPATRRRRRAGRPKAAATSGCAAVLEVDREVRRACPAP